MIMMMIHYFAWLGNDAILYKEKHYYKLPYGNISGRIMTDVE